MTSTDRRRREGIFREDAGTVDVEGFIAPSVGLVDHALYFTSSPDVLVKTRQVLDEDRLELPGAVIVWDETIGRRKGAKAVPGSWWAGNGSITMSLVFSAVASDDPSALLRSAASATLDAIGSLEPRSPVTYDGSGKFLLAEKNVGMLHYEQYKGAEIFVLRLNGNTDYSKAPKLVREQHNRLIDFIDPKSLPLGDPKTLANTLALELMTAIPKKLGQVA